MWSFSLLIVLLGAVGISSYEKTCPHFHAFLDSCSCRMSYIFGTSTVDCRGDDITVSELANVFKRFNHTTVGELRLRNLKLDTFPSTLFQGIDTDVKHVKIIDSKIGSFSDGDRPFIGLEHSLERLYIEKSTIGGTIKLGHLHNLQQLSLECSDIPEINGDWFEDGLRSLSYVRAIENKPKKIRGDAFAKLSNLETVYIERQSLEKLERSLFPNPASALKSIYFKENQISDIAEDFLTNMPALQSLTLRENNISTMEESVFKPLLYQVDRIDLEENPIVCNSRLNWYIRLNKTMKSKIYATCFLPEELSGRKVGKLLRGKTEYDP